MDWPALGRALSDLGGFALFVLVIAMAAYGLLKKWWVPGWLYQEKASDVIELRKTVARLTGELRRRGRDVDDAA